MRRRLADGIEFVEHLPALVWMTDADGSTLTFNRAWCDYTGLSQSELEAADWIELVHPADRVSASSRFLESRATGTPFSLEYRLRAKSGEMRWHHLGVHPHAFDDGAPGWIGIAIDVDERHREADLLRFLSSASEALFAGGDVAEALERVARLAVPALADWCAVYVVGKTGALVPLAVVHEDPARASDAATHFARAARDEDGALARALAGARPVVMERASDPLLERLDASAAILVPLSGRDERFGVMQFVAERTRGAFTSAEIDAAHELAARATAAYEESTLFASQQRAAADLRWLAEVGESMGESLDVGTRLVKFVHGVVPRLADWATVNLLTDDGALETVAVAHRDPAMREIAERLYGPYYGNTTSYTGTPVAIREQRSILLRGVDESLLRVHIRPDMYDDVLALGADSAFIVPLVAHGRSYGTLSAMRSEREHPFTQSEMWLIEELARRAALAIVNARSIERDRTVADAFQRASLPASLPHVPGIRFDAFYASGRSEAKIGGDWYDAFVVRDGRIVVSLGDVAGSGLSAAVIMNGVRQLLRGIAQLEPDPATMLDAADRALRSEYPDCIVTAVVGVLDRTTRSIALASAGHPAPLVRHADGSVEEIALRGLPLGLRDAQDALVSAKPTDGRERTDGHDATVVTRALDPGDIFVFYTDGLTESTRDVVEGERRLHAALARNDVARARDVAAALVDSILFDGSFDDVAILTLGIEEAYVHRFASSDGAAAHRALEAYLSELRRHADDPSALDVAALVFLELVGNAVRHAPGPVETRLSWPGGFATVEVLDEGKGFTSGKAAAPLDPLAESGRGLFLVASLAREFRIEPRARGSHARAVLNVRRAERDREMS